MGLCLFRPMGYCVLFFVLVLFIDHVADGVPVSSKDFSVSDGDSRFSILDRLGDLSDEMEDFSVDDFSEAMGRNRGKREVTRLRYKDCGKPNRAIRFEQLSVKPIPIQIPGLLDLRIKANITKKLPPLLDVKLILKKKYFDSVWVRMPCFKDYGSCRYKKLKTCTLTQEVFGCPVVQGFHNIDQKFMIPDPENTLYSQMLEGEYKAVVRARHPTTRKELACLVAHFSLKNRFSTSSPPTDSWNE